MLRDLKMKNSILTFLLVAFALTSYEASAQLIRFSNFQERTEVDFKLAQVEKLNALRLQRGLNPIRYQAYEINEPKDAYAARPLLEIQFYSLSPEEFEEVHQLYGSKSAVIPKKWTSGLHTS